MRGKGIKIIRRPGEASKNAGSPRRESANKVKPLTPDPRIKISVGG